MKKTIMLFCSAGMSTSLLVKRMQEAAERKGLYLNIFAVAQAEYKGRMRDADICMLGPQVRYMLSDAQKEGAKYNIPVVTIDMVHYGMVDGDAVLEDALKLLAKSE